MLNISLIALFLFFGSSQQLTYTCHSQRITVPANISEVQWIPSRTDNSTYFAKKQSCLFEFIVPQEYSVFIALNYIPTSDSSLILVDYNNISETLRNETNQPHFLVSPGGKLYFSTYESETLFKFVFQYFKRDDTFDPFTDNVTISNSQPRIYAAEQRLPLVITAETRVSIVAFQPTYPTFVYYMRSIVVYDGPDWNSTCLGDLYQLMTSNKQWVSSGNQMTLYSLYPFGFSAMVIFQDYENTKTLTNYRAIICYDNNFCPATIDARNGPAAVSTLIGYTNAEYLTKAVIDSNAKLDVYMGGMMKDKSNLIVSYNYNDTSNSFPQEFLGNLRTYVVTSGVGYLDFSRNSAISNFDKAYAGRKGFIASRFYKAGPVLTSQSVNDFISGVSAAGSKTYKYIVNLKEADFVQNTTLEIRISGNSKQEYSQVFSKQNMPSFNSKIEAYGTQLFVSYKAYSYQTTGFYLDYEIQNSSISTGFVLIFIFAILKYLF